MGEISCHTIERAPKRTNQIISRITALVWLVMVCLSSSCVSIISGTPSPDCSAASCCSLASKVAARLARIFSNAMRRALTEIARSAV